MRILTSKPALRWLAPAAVVAAVATSAVVASNATAEANLPPISAEQLLVDVQNAKIDGLSGTVIEKADLGIPAIPGVGGESGGDLTTLISGTHTLRVRYAGPDKFRLGVHGTYGETDTFVNGRDVWSWTSRDKTATHRTLSGDRPSGEKPAGAPQTPEEAARKVLAALTPTTTVSTDSAVQVAGRDAYELVLSPNDHKSLISQVKLAVDGENKSPLRVQVFAKDATLVFETGYTEVSFTRPEDREFVFTAPPGTEVTEGPAVEPGDRTPSTQDKAEAQDRQDATKISGEGWTTVAVTQLPADATDQSGQLRAFLDQLTTVKGGWGEGKLLAGTAFSVVLTDDNRLAVGAVEPEVLYQALAE